MTSQSGLWFVSTTPKTPSCEPGTEKKSIFPTGKSQTQVIRGSQRAQRESLTLDRLMNLRGLDKLIENNLSGQIHLRRGGDQM